MSLDAAPRAQLGRLTAPSLTRRALRGLKGVPLPARAFIASRVVVFVAGVAGVLNLSAHVPAAVTVHMSRQLGPVGSVLAGGADRFDSAYYLDMASHGIGPLASGRVAFFPLYPLVVHILTPFFGSPVLAAVVISLAAFYVALLLLHRLTELELGRPAADVAVLLLSFAPLSFFFSAIYSESLYLMLSLAAVLAARRGHWSAGYALGALATLARPTGILLAILLIGLHVRARGRLDRRVAGVIALPAALLGYLAFLHFAGYPWQAPFSVGAHWGRETVGPILGLAAGVQQALSGMRAILAGASVYHPTLFGPFTPQAESIILLANLGLGLAVTVWCWRGLPLEYTLYVVAVLMVVLSSPVNGEPLLSVDRYLLTVFPLFMAAGHWLASRRRWLTPVIVAGAALLIFYTVQFSTWSFVA